MIRTFSLPSLLMILVGCGGGKPDLIAQFETSSTPALSAATALVRSPTNSVSPPVAIPTPSPEVTPTSHSVDQARWFLLRLINEAWDMVGGDRVELGTNRAV